MGTILLIVVMAAWAAVLLPPLLRSRVENRPNSSVSDFRAQLSSLQRAVPTRGVTVRSMGRALAPSTLGRPAAGGRPAGRQVAGPRGQHSYGVARPGRADSVRMDEASLRPRVHGARDASEPVRRPLTAAGNASGDVKRRRANVLFVLVLTTVCGGFLAATTDSKAMVYMFAAGMVALGGYVYLLVTLNQRDADGSVVEARYAAPAARGERGPRARRYVPAPVADRPVAPAPRRAVVARDPLVQGWRSADEVAHDGRHEGRDDDAPPRGAAPAGGYRYRPVADAEAGDHGSFPGSGRSGRISYGRTAAARAVARDPRSMPMPRDPRDPFGREQPGRELTRGTPVRNGRHPTGQHPVQRRRSPVADRTYSQAG